MCVIAIKPLNVDLPADDKLKLMWDTNKDGAGFMYSLDNSVYIDKGFMTFDDLKMGIASLKELLEKRNLTFKDIPMVMHFRITTHGGTSPENTHPFPISDKEEHLRALSVKAPLAVAHNGVISTVDKEATLSDTQVYVRDILAVIYSFKKSFTEDDKLTKFISATIGYSKLAFLSGDGSITTYGEFKEPVEKDGLSYSNLNHIPYKYEYKPVKYDYSKNKMWYDDDDCDTGCFVTKKDFVVGQKYVMNKTSPYTFKDDIGKVYVYLGHSDSYGGYANYGRFEDVETKVIYHRSTYYFSPYDEEKRKHQIGGSNNKETEEIQQSADRTLYTAHIIANAVLYTVPLHTFLGNYETLKKYSIEQYGKNSFYTESVEFSEVKYTVYTTTNCWFYSPTFDKYLYRNKDGSFVALESEVNCEIDVVGSLLFWVSKPSDIYDESFEALSQKNKDIYGEKLVFTDVTIYVMNKNK